MAHADNCEVCDWNNMGMIEYDGIQVNIITQVIINYDRYGGGYQFNMYSDSITDTSGNPIIMEEDTPLVKWFEDMYNYSKSVGKILYIK